MISDLLAMAANVAHHYLSGPPLIELDVNRSVEKTTFTLGYRPGEFNQ